MDGVLFDSIPYAREEFSKMFPGLTYEQYNEINTGNVFDESQKYSHLRISETEEQKQQRHNAYAKNKSKALLFNGIKKLLQALLSSGHMLVLNTNAFNRNCIPLLENGKIKDYCNFIVSAEISKN